MSIARFPITVRRLSRTPGFTIAALLTLALGIGASTAIFSVVYSVLLKPLPYPNPDSLVVVWLKAPGIGLNRELVASPATFFNLLEEGQTFSAQGIWQAGGSTLTGGGSPEQLAGVSLSSGTLAALGVPPALGRWFTEADDRPGASPAVILSHGFWKRRFGGVPTVIGQKIILDGRAHEVIGVMPDQFRVVDRAADVLTPLQLDRARVFIGNFSYNHVARIKSGRTHEQASADVARVLPMLIKKFPLAPGMSPAMLENARLAPDLKPLQAQVVGNAGQALWVILGTVLLLLLIACANVANLLLVRAEGRRQELSVRAALGATPGGIAKELLAEALLLAAGAGILGVGLAEALLRLLLRLQPSNLPRLNEIGIDEVVLAFAVGVSLVTGLVFGAFPAIKYAGRALQNSLRGGGRTASDSRDRRRTRDVLVVVQVALALILLTGSGLMIQSVRHMNAVSPGFTHPEQIQTVRLVLPSTQFADPVAAMRAQQELAEKLKSIPGVVSAAFTNSVTMDGNVNADPLWVEDRPQQGDTIPPIRRYKHVSPGSFATLGNPILAGRDFTWTDLYDFRPVVILSDKLAREFWGSPQAAIGKRVRENPKGMWREVIGVAGNEYDNGVDRPPADVIYWPALKKDFWEPGPQASRRPVFALRTSRAATAPLLEEMRQAVWSVHRDIPLAQVRTMEEIYSRSMARTSFVLVLLSISAGFALLIGIIGLYGVISYSISRRTREIGIRMALGAAPGSVRRMFLQEGLSLAALGVAAGAAGAVPLTRLMESLLFGVSALDPATFAVAAVLLTAAALAAAYLPSRHASRVDPCEALRSE